jgi:mRNA interferase RelE/StbE
LKYRVEVTTSAAKELRKLRKRIQPKIMKAISDRISGLADEPKPPGAEKVEGYWRVRSGNYRIVYAVEEEALSLVIVRVGPRREVYRRL